MGNCCFPSKIQLEDKVAGDERLIPEGEISLFFSEEFDCYILRFRLRNFEQYCDSLWPEGQRSSYITDSDSDFGSDSIVDVPN